MKRHLLNLVTLLSLLAAVAVAALWVRSRFAWDQLAWGPRPKSTTRLPG